MPLRNVATSFTIEQQRLEINNLAGDVNNIATGVTNVGTAATANALAAGATGVDLTLSGTLTVNGSQTILNTATLEVEDKNIVIAKGSTTDAAASGGGITLKGADDKTLLYDQASDEWQFNKPLRVEGSQEYTASASSLETSVTKAAFRVKGSTNSSDSLFIGVENVNADPYIQGNNGIGNNAKNLLLNPYGGKVGIGTVTPNRDLEIYKDDAQASIGIIASTTGQSSLWLANTGDINVGGIYYEHSNNALGFRVNDSSDVLRIDSSGRLLLGTTTEGRATYGEKFTLAGSGHCGMTIRSGDTSYGILHFSDGTSGANEYDGMVEYLHGASPRMRLFAGGKYNILMNGGGSTVLNHNENPKLETTSSGVTVTGNISDDKGNVRSVPTSPLSGTHAGGYVMLASDVGKCVSMSGDVTLQSASGGGPFGGGDVITILNGSGSAITLNQGTGLTLYDSGTGNTGNRTLGARGMATVIYMYGGNTAYISGAQLT